MITEKILLFIINTIIAIAIIFGMLRLFSFFGSADLAMLLLGLVVSFISTVIYLADVLSEKRKDNKSVRLSQNAKNTLLVADILGLVLMILGAV